MRVAATVLALVLAATAGRAATDLPPELCEAVDGLELREGVGELLVRAANFGLVSGIPAKRKFLRGVGHLLAVLEDDEMAQLVAECGYALFEGSGEDRVVRLSGAFNPATAPPPDEFAGRLLKILAPYLDKAGECLPACAEDETWTSFPLDVRILGVISLVDTGHVVERRKIGAYGAILTMLKAVLKTMSAVDHRGAVTVKDLIDDACAEVFGGSGAFSAVASPTVADSSGGSPPPAVSAIGWAGDTAKWMAELPDAVALGTLTIPCSHDSGMVEGTASHAIPVEGIEGLFLNHDRSVGDQLRAGARWFDLRPEIHDGEIHAFHRTSNALAEKYLGGAVGGCGEAFRKIFEETRGFLEENPSETVFFNVSHWHVSGDAARKSEVKQAVLSLMAEFGGMFLSWPSGEEAPSVNAMPLGRARGRAIAVLREFEPDPANGIWGEIQDRATAPGFMSTTGRSADCADYERMRARQLAQWEATKDLDPGESAPWTPFLLTWQFDVFDLDNTNRRMAERVNPHLGAFLLEGIARTGRNPGFVNLDYVTPEVCSKVIACNFNGFARNGTAVRVRPIANAEVAVLADGMAVVADEGLHAVRKGADVTVVVTPADGWEFATGAADFTFAIPGVSAFAEVAVPGVPARVPAWTAHALNPSGGNGAFAAPKRTTEYLGTLVDSSARAAVGTVSAKVTKPDRRGRVTVSATVKFAADGQSSVHKAKGVTVPEGGPLEVVLPAANRKSAAHEVRVVLGADSLSGTVDGTLEIDGRRDVFAAKGDPARDALAPLAGAWNGWLADAVGVDAVPFSAQVGKNGSVCVKGWIGGRAYSCSAKAEVGEGVIAVPVVWRKTVNGELASLAFRLTFDPVRGTASVRDLSAFRAWRKSTGDLREVGAFGFVEAGRPGLDKAAFKALPVRIQTGSGSVEGLNTLAHAVKTGLVTGSVKLAADPKVRAKKAHGVVIGGVGVGRAELDGVPVVFRIGDGGDGLAGAGP